MVHLGQTVHLSCIKMTTILKQTELSLITLECHRVHPKWFLRLCYVQRKLCTYLASRLALSPNGLNWASTWASSFRSSNRCVKNDFWAYGMFGANPAPIWHRHNHCLQTDRNKIPQDPHHLGVSLGASKMIFEPVVCLAQALHLSCTDTNIISKRIKTRFHKTHVT
jgi:hypothetical protein